MDRVVGFSCKKRGCAHCVADAVWPKLPLTWWIEYHLMSRCGSGLSVPHRLRYRMAYDADLLSPVMRIFSRVVF